MGYVSTSFAHLKAVIFLHFSLQSSSGYIWLEGESLGSEFPVCPQILWMCVDLHHYIIALAIGLVFFVLPPQSHVFCRFSIPDAASTMVCSLVVYKNLFFSLLTPCFLFAITPTSKVYKPQVDGCSWSFNLLFRGCRGTVNNHFQFHLTNKHTISKIQSLLMTSVCLIVHLRHKIVHNPGRFGFKAMF